MRFLAEQVQDVLGVDIVRDPGLQTDYSFRIGDHAVVLLKSTIYWFRANWPIAHELGHLALGHHVSDGDPPREGPAEPLQVKFLLPEDVVRELNWRTLEFAELALWLWSAGVSTAALKQPTQDLEITPSERDPGALEGTTPKLLRAHVDLTAERHAGRTDDPIWARENATTGRQFPAQVVAALTERVEAGNADPYVLAWVREVPVDELTWPEPDLESRRAELRGVVGDGDTQLVRPVRCPVSAGHSTRLASSRGQEDAKPSVAGVRARALADHSWRPTPSRGIRDPGSGMRSAT